MLGTYFQIQMRALGGRQHGRRSAALWRMGECLCVAMGGGQTVQTHALLAEYDVEPGIEAGRTPGLGVARLLFQDLLPGEVHELHLRLPRRLDLLTHTTCEQGVWCGCR